MSIVGQAGSQDGQTLLAAAASPEEDLLTLSLGDSARLWPLEVAAQMGSHSPHTLINVLASQARSTSLESLSDRQLETAVEATLTRLLVVCQEVGRGMLQRGTGLVVTVLACEEADALSTILDQAAIGLMRVLGVEWASQGVRVVTVVPRERSHSENWQVPVAETIRYLMGASFVTASELVIGA